MYTAILLYNPELLIVISKITIATKYEGWVLSHI